MSRKPRIDLLALRRGVSLLALLPPDARPRKIGNNRWRAFCSFHEDGASPAMAVDLTENGWMFHCFACGESGSVIDYVMRTQSLRLGDAIERMAAGGFVALTPPPPRPKAAYVVACSGKGCGATLDVEASEVASLGLGVGTRERPGVAWSFPADGADFAAWCPRCMRAAMLRRSPHSRLGGARPTQ